MRLYWGARSKALADAVKRTLGYGVLRLGVAEIAFGKRLNLRAILECEIAKTQKCATAVIVCTLMDEAFRW